VTRKDRSSRSSKSQSRVEINLHKRQSEAFESEANEILFGGSAGGGKSFFMRAAAISWCAEIPGLQVYLFRRIREDLVKNHFEGPKGFRALLGPWVDGGFVQIVEDEIRFWNGSKLYLCHCKDEKDIYKYQGAEIHVLMIDELTHFTDPMYRFLRNRVRMVGLDIPEKWKGRFPRILCSANPGNVGHLFVKSTFVDGCQPFELRQMPPHQGGMIRQFIPARLEDNPSMEKDDPGYEQRLQGLGSESLVKAMRYGDWNVVEGAFFDKWDTARHVVRPFEIPKHWLRIRSMDWGSAKPFSVGWWAVVPDDFPLDDGRTLPRGCLVRYREWYGCTGVPDVGLKLTAEEVAEGIKQLEKNEKISVGVLDPSAFATNGGPSIAERMYKHKKIAFRPADNSRVTQRGAMGGWDMFRQRMIGESYERPMMVVFQTCLDFIRTVPVLQHDPHRPEDLNTDGEDHCFAAGTMVDTLDGPKPIESLVGTEGLVLSRDGMYRPYRSARLTRKNAETVWLTFEDGRKVRCTPDHRFLDIDGEPRYALTLKGRSVKCVQPLLATPSKSSLGSDTISVDATSRKGVHASILKSGAISTAPQQKAATSTIGMVTHQTTLLKTLSASLQQSIWAAGTARQVPSAASNQSRLRGAEPSSGTRLKQASLGIGNSIANTVLLPCQKLLTSCVCFAENLSAAISGAASALTPASLHFAGHRVPTTRRAVVPFAQKTFQSANTRSSAPVQEFAGSVRVVSVAPAGKADVYCLTVPSMGYFAIEGGIVAKNCADEARYCMMSRPWIAKQAEEKAKPKTLQNISLNDLWAAQPKYNDERI